LIKAYRAGERAQIQGLAEALGWPFEFRRVVHRRIGAALDVLRGSNLLGIDRQRSDSLSAPWPDLVITSGMRNEPVARWIRTQSRGRTRIVHVGRPWAPARRFDLVITTPQYRLPEHPRILQNSTTLHGVNAERLGAESRRWSPRLANLPSPRIAVMVGGHSGPYAFGPHAARCLGEAASALANSRGGSLLVTTSARTPHAAITALEEATSVPAQVYRWRPDDADNPYYGYLALADELIVTCDSIAMLSEACATGRPVHIFDQGRVRAGPVDFRLAAFGYRLLMAIGPRRLSRDVGLVHADLINRGRAVFLGEPLPERSPPPLNDVQRAVQRVTALFSAR
jgi:mitochondrial fission protein ELM1